MVTPIHRKILKEFRETGFRAEQLRKFYVTERSRRNAMEHLLANCLIHDDENGRFSVIKEYSI